MSTSSAPRKQAIVIAGMHRSGTSALARLLIGLGCDTPKTLLEGDVHNAEGYWESKKIVALNDALLSSAGSSWDDWTRFDPTWYDSAVVEGFGQRAVETLTAEFGDSPLFVLKDPRICRLLPFWQAALERFGAAMRVVAPLRDPLEVAASLQARDAIEAPFAVLIWLRHVLAAEADSRQEQRAFVAYDDLLRDWSAVADKLAVELDMRWPSRSTTARMAIDASLKPSLRHHVKATAGVAGSLSPWAHTVFEILQRWSREKQRSTDTAQLDQVRALLDDAAEEFAAPLAIGMRRGQSVRTLDERIDVLDLAVRDKDQLIETLDGQIRERDEQVAQRDAKIDEMSGMVSQRDYQIVAAEQKIREQAQTVDSLHNTLDERAGEIANLEADADSLRHTVAEKDERIASLNQRVDVSQQEIDSARQENDAAQQALAAIKQSTSWRITKPLRLLKMAAIRIGPAKALIGVGARFLFSVAHGLWRLLPLSASHRTQLRMLLATRLPTSWARHLLPARPTSAEYRPAHWLELPDLAYDAATDGSPLPILFDPQFYLETNEDVRQSDIDPLQHYMKHGAGEGRLPIAIDAAEIDSMVSSLHRLDPTESAASGFDADFYRAVYTDVAELDDRSAEKHYRMHGRLEGRMGSKVEFIQQVCDHPCEIPLDFNAAEYVRLYPDLAPFSERPALDALRHYMISGRWEPRLHTLRLGRRLETEGEVEALPPALACESPLLCVLVHVYYPELWHEIAAYIRNIPQHLYQLHVNLVTTIGSHQLIASIRASFPDAKIQISDNFGRDIGGHCQLLRNIDMDDFRFFLLLHTKNSPHLGAGGAQLWRRRLLMPLLGDRQTAIDNLALLLSDDSVGQIGGRRCRDKNLHKNKNKHRQLLARLNIAATQEASEFVSGTMMFLRREVVQRVYQAIENTPFENGDDKPLEFHVDSQWAHAVERLFGDVVRDLGYRTVWR